jgi:hypothetical protein
MRNKKTSGKISAQPRLHQRAAEIQAYGTVNHLLPLELEEPVRLEMTAQLTADQGSSDIIECRLGKERGLCRP